MIVRSSLKYTEAWISSLPVPVLLIATGAEPGASITMVPMPRVPTPNVPAPGWAKPKMPGVVMSPGAMMKASDLTLSPMFKVPKVTLASSVMVCAPKILTLRLAISPMPSGEPASPTQLALLVQE